MRPTSQGLLLALCSAFVLTSLRSTAAHSGEPLHQLRKRIIQGTTAHPRFRYPWVAALFVAPTGDTDHYAFSCGGTLLNEEWVLTAARCSFTSAAGSGGPDDWKRTRVETGRFDLRKDVAEERKGRYDVGFQATHPDFVAGDVRRFNDVALWRLKGRAVGPATVGLATSDELTKPGTSAVTAGWGRRETTSDDISVLLSDADLRILSGEDCERRLRDRDEGPVFEVSTQICAVGLRDQIGLSRGDEGAPLIVYVEDGGKRVPVVVGIASRAVERDGTTYSIFTKVSRYVPWITETIEKHSVKACI